GGQGVPPPDPAGAAPAGAGAAARPLAERPADLGRRGPHRGPRRADRVEPRVRPVPDRLCGGGPRDPRGSGGPPGGARGAPGRGAAHGRALVRARARPRGGGAGGGGAGLPGRARPGPGARGCRGQPGPPAPGVGQGGGGRGAVPGGAGAAPTPCHGRLQPGDGARGPGAAGGGDRRLPARARGGRAVRRRALQPGPAVREGGEPDRGAPASPRLPASERTEMTGAMRVLVGTSGYAYKEWKGAFYPEKLPADGMLRFYAGRLPTVEINNTFYRLPSERLLAGWADQVPPGFRFGLKASQRITHLSRLTDFEALEYFLRTANVLGERLGPTLFQLPPTMRKDLPRLRDFLARLPRGWRA